MMLLRLFWEFFKIGLFAVGGGMATIPFLYDLSDRTGWFTYTQLADMIAISESTPGPIGVNMATYVGYEMSGVLGSISTTLGFVAPSIIIIVIVSIIYIVFFSINIIPVNICNSCYFNYIRSYRIYCNT